ncbi:MAG: OmpH family outer membrane protein [Flavobacteriales bacterium]|nr:MAG: OmpH family outer membrane protein [Flavobacteriales bacterium]
MKKNITIIGLTVFVAINLVMNIIDRKTNKKIAYVRSQDLVYAYTGMKEMQLKFQDQSKTWEANLDTLKMDFQRAVAQYQNDAAKLTAQERLTRENMLDMQQKNVYKYAESIAAKSKEEEEKMLGGVLNQVNSFVEKYGKKNGYDLILGTTSSGSILYGEEAIDITQELIEEINIDYEGK